MARKKSDEKNLTSIEDFVKDSDVYVVEDVINLKDSTSEDKLEEKIDKMEENLDNTSEEKNKMSIDENLGEEFNNVEVETDHTVNMRDAVMMEYKVVVVKTHFPSPATKVTSVIQATGQVDELIAASGQLKMISGRFYYVPVKTTCGYIDVENVLSDDYIIKVTSAIADKIDVKFVKDNLACISTHFPGFDLRDDTTLCILIPWK